MEQNIYSNYNYRLTDQILWENRNTYIELLEQYLTAKIDSEEVVDTFFALYGHHNNQSARISENPEKLKTISLTSKSEGFTDLLEFIFSACEALDIEETDDTSGYPLSENRFRKEISLRLQELRNYD